MKQRSIVFIFSLFIGVGLLANSAVARDWVRVEIPDTKCGDGSPYAVFLDLKNHATDKMVFYFQGGGACWGETSCFKLDLSRLTVSKSPTAVDAYFSDDPSQSVVADHSMVYFPYCSGDVFAGKHTAVYGKKKKTVFHWGMLNVQRALKYLSQGWVDFEAIHSAVLYGYSAGAIGAMLHLDSLQPYLPNASRKTAVFDAPGFHFGKKFFKKFPGALVQDFTESFQRLGMPFDGKNGNVGQHMIKVCQKHADWMIGTLQGSQDIVMSALFATMHPWVHERIVYGKKGIFQATEDPFDNCSAWVPRSLQHTFLMKRKSMRIKAGPVSAEDFVTELITGFGGLSYRDY